ncbi:septal ring lytic transglycosylase RlpA family protein [Aquamicrobium soli]|jgi:rare lipoprotein A|uniref:Endolytic peptidoglycan transglycosylase RlpA n=1 Tax=Aquamicrobium soli TaxID=1811518 RepID=A0ABV7KCM6_9HYPH
MQTSTRLRLSRASAFVLLAASAALLAACATPQPKDSARKKHPKEYFAESEYGVKASPRVAFSKFNVPRGGGRDQTGKPYQVRGKWYYPKEEKGYSKVGAASWYGDAFHGRLTANGEVYDMTHLTAAHPTMPLPSYARVTNLANGSSVIVRVNDRGPYSEGRIIDLSERAASMLDYAHSGTAKVKVDYIGRAPLDGRDDQYLMASYRPGNRAPDPSDGLPTGVMIAMNGNTPSADVGAGAIPFPGQLTDTRPAFAAEPAMTAQAATFDFAPLPEFGPIVPQRPDSGLAPQPPFAMASLSYADERVQTAWGAFAALDKGRAAATGWKQAAHPADASSADDYIAAGTYQTAAEAQKVASELSGIGRSVIERTRHDGKVWYSVNLYPTGSDNLDTMLQSAWSHGAPDALAVRD